MAKAADQFRSTDVTFWGVLALGAWGIAVLSANIGALIPPDAFAALHTSRLDGTTLAQVRQQVAGLEAEANRMRRENNVLLQRLDLAEQARTDAARRIGALEVSLPDLVAQLDAGPRLDPEVTAAVTLPPAETFAAEGGTVTVEQQPLVPPAISLPTLVVPGQNAAAPAGPVANGEQFGVALGLPTLPADAEAQWQGYLTKVGTLLIGLWPVLADAEDGDGKTVVAGPISTLSQAAELCTRMDRVGIRCAAVPFKGEPLPLLN